MQRPSNEINICSFFISSFSLTLSSLKVPLLSIFGMSSYWFAGMQNLSIQLLFKAQKAHQQCPFWEPYLYASIFYYRRSWHCNIRIDTVINESVKDLERPLPIEKGWVWPWCLNDPGKGELAIFVLHVLKPGINLPKNWLSSMIGQYVTP